jgi:LacI family transcriptional regulator
VPQQIALMGFSNWFISQVLTPKLSTVDQPSLLMGVESFNLLLEEINCHKERRPFTPKTVVLETKTIIRESSIRIL